MLTRHQKVLKEKMYEIAYSIRFFSYTHYFTCIVRPIYLSRDFLNNNPKLLVLFKDLICNTYEKPTKSYYKITFFEFQRKFRGIAQILFRHFFFCQQLSFKEFKSGATDLIDSIHDYLIKNPVDGKKIDRSLITTRLLFCYNHLLSHYWQYSERKTLPFDKMIKSQIHKMCHNFNDNFLYYYCYDLDGKFQGVYYTNKSCHIHGLTPSDPDWQQYCKHLICFDCDEYRLSDKLYVYCDHYDLLLNYGIKEFAFEMGAFAIAAGDNYDGVDAPFCQTAHICDLCGNSLYARTIYNHIMENIDLSDHVKKKYAGSVGVN